MLCQGMDRVRVELEDLDNDSSHFLHVFIEVQLVCFDYKLKFFLCLWFEIDFEPAFLL